MNVLVDTSLWSLALRRRAQDLNTAETLLVGELGELVKEGRTRILGLIRQELLSGIKSIDQYEKLRSILRAFRDEHVETTDYEAAAKASNVFRSKGVAVSVGDALICSVSTERNWRIFTTDPDFRNYARILPLQLHAPRK